MTTSRRKHEHIKIALEEQIQHKNKTTGFENWDFIHNALPDLNWENIRTDDSFLGKRLSFPFMITAITGGFDGAQKINAALAEACQSEKIALGIGSQRQLLENQNHLDSFRIVRKNAPDIPIVGNIGASEIVNYQDATPFRGLIEEIEADALAVHLNVLQERLQPEGNKQFSGVLKAIERLVNDLDVPVIAKEIGCGISYETAKQLKNAGVHAIDIAGAGGTSWAAIESFRMENTRLAETFWDWGIPTARSLEMVAKIQDLTIIASGGLENGITLAKAIALGADLGGAALPFLKTLESSGTEGLINEICLWREELKTVMLLTGSASIEAFKKGQLIYKLNP